MKDFIIILGIIIGIVMFNISKKTKKYKHINSIGKFIIMICSIIAISSFIRGFIDGMIAAK
ncbi:hypothetical protein NHI66_003133 [Clostridium botulinum]|nr:hypothetical protein [Clostridium botulinum]